MNELRELGSTDVIVSGSEVSFPTYEAYLHRAEDIAAYIQSIELTEESVKEAKGVVADARKVTDGLNRKRIDLKRELLKSYNHFESQIKTICSVIDESESELRSKIRALDDAERDAKEETLKGIWKERAWAYEFPKMRPDAFELWLTPVHLNKTTSLASAEKDMVAWLEKTEKEMNVARGMGEEYLTEYIKTVNLADAVDQVNDTHAVRQTVRSVTQEEIASFIIVGKPNIILAEKLLTENGIKFEKENH